MGQVREVMAARLHTVGPEETVGEAVAVMAQHRIGSVLIMEGDRLLGIFTERDTVRALSQAHDAARHEIVSWMTHDPKTVAPDTETEDALRTMLDNGFRHLPVVEDGKVVGMVSMRDLAG
ncbi:MAG: CBS domain-containing protein [Chloroflexi bacterium]|nr:MAG: CBS domain-containing protein [Chloroflexota bacterium]TMF35940.1 MAG: CBS domain-containing protein [Chloroflexota bacterium]